MRSPPFLMAATLWLATALAGCEGKTDDTGTGDGGSGDGGGAAECNTDNEECGPGVGGCGGEGPSMLPGSDCVACHSPGNYEEDEDTFFSAAGTVYTDYWGTAPASGAIVRVTDANGDTVEMTANAVGNFFTEQTLVPPLDAEVELDGEVMTMSTAVDTGACQTCHMCEGSAGGKLRAP